MSNNRYDANCDLVLEMEEAGIGVEEILQYAHGCLTRAEVAALSQGLEGLMGNSPNSESEAGAFPPAEASAFV